ncbi:MAG: branched-chain amino acid ABC transporter permease, partial [Anaerolineae bacterium]
MQFIIQQILNALQLGSVYALIALGYTMVYGILRMINFAHGDIFMVSTYIGFFSASFLLGHLLHLPGVIVFVLTMLIAMLGTSLLAIFIERVAYKPLRQAPRISAVITALGIGLVLENTTLATIGPEPRILPQVIPVINFNVGEVAISTIQVVILVISAIVMFILDTIVRKTMTGMAMRAISFDKSVVPLMGVPVDRIISITFALGSSMAAVGGILYG